MKRPIFFIWHEKALIGWNGKMGRWPMLKDSPRHEEAIFPHVTWRNIDWLKWLNGWMANTIVNARFSMCFPMTWSKGKCEFKYQYDEDALISWKTKFENHFEFNNFSSIGWKIAKSLSYKVNAQYHGSFLVSKCPFL